MPIFYFLDGNKKYEIEMIPKTQKMAYHESDDLFVGPPGHYSLKLRSLEGGPIPEGEIYILVKRAGKTNVPVSRCEKHYESGRDSVMAAVGDDVDECYTRVDGQDFYGVNWRLADDGMMEAETRVSFCCTNYDISRAKKNWWQFLVFTSGKQSTFIAYA